jgi:hypothetical protein
MMARIRSFPCWLSGLALVWLLASCAPPPLGTPVDASIIYTQAVQTVSAKLTLDAGGTAVAVLTSMAQGTPPPSATPDMSATATVFNELPTFTAQPPTPTSYPPTPTAPRIPCDWLEFISDVTVPDGKEVSPGTQFVKTWRLRNIGSCTWTGDYDLVFTSGDQMSGAPVVPLTAQIPPGTMADVSVTLTAPASAGTYTGYWQLRNAGGVLFGGGGDADGTFSVSIKVDPGDEILYDMAERYCRADWTNSRLPLLCPTGIEDEVLGFVSRSNSLRLESGEREDEPTLITHPDRGGFMRFDFLGEQGLIAGAFPDQLIEDGDRFEAIIGCQFGHEECNVLFYLLLQKPNGNYEIIASWQEYYDGNLTTVSVDLSEWAGREIGLILAVVANGSQLGDYAIWIHPRLVR